MEREGAEFRGQGRRRGRLGTRTHTEGGAEGGILHMLNFNS